MAAVVVYREVVPRPIQASGASPSSGPQYYPDWQGLLHVARPIGDAVGPVHLIEFGDLECPACRQFHAEVLPKLKRRFGSKVNVSFVHYPLSIHRFARPAARAAECAASQARFGPFVEVVFANQDSLGLKSWTSMARDAGLGDSTTFARCLATIDAARVDSGVAVARRLGLNGTPTVIVNGWRVPNPSSEELPRAIEDLLSGRDPYPKARN